MRYRILIVSDSVEWCESLNTGFKLNGSFHVLGILSTPELIDSGVSLYPDVVLWEVNDDPLPLISEIKTKSPFFPPGNHFAGAWPV